MTDTNNDRAVIGGNRGPEWIEGIQSQLQLDYKHLLDRVPPLLERARLLPKTIENETALGETGKVIIEIRDLIKSLDAAHDAEKSPFLQAGGVVDQTFFGPIDKLGRRSPRNQAGARDILQARVDDWTARKVAAERAERERIAREAAEELRKRQEAEAEAARLAEEARLAAERARTPHTAEAKQEVAQAAAAEAEAARVDTMMAADKVEQTFTGTKAKSADIARTRLDDFGVLSTAKQEAYATVVDESKLDMAKLWPFIKLEVKEQALRAWAKQTGHKVQMEGASIGFRDKGVVR